MDLDKLVTEIREFPGVTRKHVIADVVSFLPTQGYPNVIADFGEDAAVLDYGKEKNGEVLLFAADSIWGKLIESNPFFAGYCSVLVNVNDITAMGGTPIAMVDNLSIRDSGIYKEILRGIQNGVKKFNVPVVGGHVNPDCADNTIDIAIIGRAKKEDVILSSTAEAGDTVIFAVDIDGSYHPDYKYAWDSTSHKSSEIVQKQLEIMREIGKRKLATAAKDISNPGYLGTLGMLLESSGVGAVVNVEAVPRPPNVQNDADFITWLESYPGYAYVLTCRPENADEIIRLFNKQKVSANAVGAIEDGKKLTVTDNNGKTRKTIFDFAVDRITGLKKGEK